MRPASWAALETVNSPLSLLVTSARWHNGGETPTIPANGGVQKKAELADVKSLGPYIYTTSYTYLEDSLECSVSFSVQGSQQCRVLRRKG